MIYRNDQYYLNISIKENGQNITEDDVDEMIIKLGSVIKKMSDGDILYDSFLNAWLYPLTIDQAQTLSNGTLIQAWFSRDDEFFSSNTSPINVGNSIITREDTGK